MWKIVRVNLQGGRAVFELVTLRERLPRKLALLADRQHTTTSHVGNGTSQDEPTGLHTGHAVKLAVKGIRKGIHGAFESGAVCKQWCEIPEEHPGWG